MTVFTDDDFKRLKEGRELIKMAKVAIDGELFDALLARLEAAEKCAEQFAGSCCVEEGIVKAWREAAGK